MGSPKPGHTVSGSREDDVLQLIRETLGNGIEALGRRDDAAVVTIPGVPGAPEGVQATALVASVDSVVEGVHVDRSLCRPADIGWKALMGALSDLAAMGAAPLGALVALCLPGGAGEGELAVGVMSGVGEAATASRCPVLGGDVSEAAQLVVAVSVLGTVGGAGGCAGPGPVTRAGALPGDVLLLTGPCGGSAAGLRTLRADAGADAAAGLGRAYTRPVARLREGELARRAGAHAMIDVSDGLALDLHRLADASGVGFHLDTVPVAAGATLHEALGGGEDYELVVAVDERIGDALFSSFESQGLRPPVRIGVAVADPARRVLGDAPLERLGWQHRIG